MYERQCTVRNLSLSRWRLSGDWPLIVGQTCSPSVKLPNEQQACVAAGVVRWVQEGEYGIETLIADQTAQEQVEAKVRQGIEGLML